MKLTEKFNWVDPEYVTTPQSRFVETFKDSWWLVNDENQVCLYRHFKTDPLAAQCNPDKRVAEKVLQMEAIPGATDIMKLPLAFVDADPGGR